jgi:hypothetical protein
MNGAVTRPPPRGLKISHVIAIALELAIVAVLAGHRVWEGLVLVAAYAWFSATWAALFNRDD